MWGTKCTNCNIMAQVTQNIWTAELRGGGLGGYVKVLHTTSD